MESERIKLSAGSAGYAEEEAKKEVEQKTVQGIGIITGIDIAVRTLGSFLNAPKDIPRTGK